MSRSFWLAAQALVALTLMAGCGPSLVPVQGKVTVDGQPLTTGNITYYPADGKAQDETNVGYATVQSDGTYKLADGKSGIAAGKYKVVITAGMPSNPADPYSVPISLVNSQFSELARTPLEVEVSPDAPADRYDLKVTK